MRAFTRMRLAVVTCALWSGACDPSIVIGQPGDGGASDGGAKVADAATDGGFQAEIVTGCPRVLLGRSRAAEFSGDTSGLPNLVISSRLEWTDAPDDALEFIADTTGTYRIELISSNLSLGASAMDFSTGQLVPFTRSACPPPGTVVSIDGFYGQGDEVALIEGQSLVVFVSAPYQGLHAEGHLASAVTVGRPALGFVDRRRALSCSALSRCRGCEP